MRGVATCAGLCFLLAGVLLASDPSKKWVDTGKACLQAGRTADALLAFSNAVTSDPNDPDAVGWYGVALSLTSRTDADREEAATRLAESRAKGCKVPEVMRETGRIRFLQGRYKECLDALAEYDAARPGDWMSAEWRGIALCRTGRHKEALEALTQAKKLGCPNTQMCEYYLGVCHRELGEKEEARASFQGAYDAAPTSPFGLAARPFLGLPGRERAWTCWQRAYGGFDTNPIALGNDTQIVPGQKRKEAWFGALAAGGSYRFDLSDKVDLLLAAEGERTLYSGAARANTDEVRVDAVTDWWVSERFGAHLDLRYDHTEFAFEPFADAFTVSPWIAWKETGWLTGTVEYRYTTREVDPTFSFQLDPDGHDNEVTVSERARVPGTELELRLSYDHVWAATEGNEFAHEENGVSFRAQHPLVWGIVASASVEYDAARYDHASVESLTGERRDDDIVTVQAMLRRDFGAHWTVYFSATVVDHESDVKLYDYDRNVWTLGVEHRF